MLAKSSFCLSYRFQVLEVLHCHGSCHFALVWHSTIIVQRTLNWHLWIRLFLLSLHRIRALNLYNIHLTLVSAFHHKSVLSLWRCKICLWSHYKVWEGSSLFHILCILWRAVLSLRCARTCDLLLRHLKLSWVRCPNCCWWGLLKPHLCIVELWRQPPPRLTNYIISSINEDVLPMIVLS